jgi:creatinine amidohydrolase/Fe(II)-dependent formamide hydrolase-like protein
MDGTVFWEDMTWRELDAAIARRPIAFVPCGALEWHGEHLPLGCDSFRGAAVCRRAAEIGGGVVLPALYTTAPGFSAYRGSIFFSGRLVKALTLELLRELEKVGFRVAVLLLGHAGQAQEEAFGEPAAAYSRSHRLATLVTTGLEWVPASARVPMGHAGSGETAQCMAARPGSAKLDRFDPGQTRLPRYEGLDPETYSDGFSAALQEHVRRHMTATKYPWEADLARVATEAVGRQHLEAMAQELARRAGELLAAQPS